MAYAADLNVLEDRHERITDLQGHAQTEDAEQRAEALVEERRAADDRHAIETKTLSAKLAAAAAEKHALQAGFEARLATMKGELSTAQDTVKSNAAKTEEILTWQHSSIFQTAKTKPSPPAQKEVSCCNLPADSATHRDLLQHSHCTSS